MCVCVCVWATNRVTISGKTASGPSPRRSGVAGMIRVRALRLGPGRVGLGPARESLADLETPPAAAGPHSALSSPGPGELDRAAAPTADRGHGHLAHALYRVFASRALNIPGWESAIDRTSTVRATVISLTPTESARGARDGVCSSHRRSGPRANAAAMSDAASDAAGSGERRGEDRARVMRHGRSGDSDERRRDHAHGRRRGVDGPGRGADGPAMAP